MNQNDLLPTSNATNAYDLLSDICRIIEEEPKRLDMGEVLVNEPVELQRFYGIKGTIPACGTVGCVAGWTNVLKGSANKGLYAAANILGLDDSQIDELFLTFPSASRYVSVADHAAEELVLIRAFQARYAEQLKAKAV